MPVSGWVLTLSPDIAQRAHVVQLLSADPRVTLGDLVGARLPFVLETTIPDEERVLLETLSEHMGVVFMDLVCLDFSDVEVYNGAPRRGGRLEPADCTPREVSS